MMSYTLTPEAETNVLDIIDHIALDSPDAADRVLDEFEDLFQRLAETPGLGHYRDELLDRRHRFVSLYSYVVVYRWQTTPLEIIAIVHGARNLERYFERHPQ